MKIQRVPADTETKANDGLWIKIGTGKWKAIREHNGIRLGQVFRKPGRRADRRRTW